MYALRKHTLQFNITASQDKCSAMRTRNAEERATGRMAFVFSSSRSDGTSSPKMAELRQMSVFRVGKCLFRLKARNYQRVDDACDEDSTNTCASSIYQPKAHDRNTDILNLL